jgi:hypothetical protein
MCHLDFWVVAASRPQAVEKANRALSEAEESQPVHLGLGIAEASFWVSDELRVTEADITEERTAPPLPDKAIHHLLQAGYECGGADLESWREVLLDDDEAHWMKGFQVGDDWGGAIYGHMQVCVSSHHTGRWHFKILAYLYPVAHSCDLSGEPGSLRYKVDFSDAQDDIREEQLPQALAAYEQKFCNLIYTLRAADPVDGLPLSEAEAQAGKIQGFMQRFELREEAEAFLR